MRKVLLLLIAACLLFLLAACKSSHAVTSQATATRSSDSTRIEYRERVVFVPDTVYAEIPVQTAERLTADTISILENSFAVSEARFTADGSLFHTLATKPQSVPVITQDRVVYRDTVIYQDRTLTNTTHSRFYKEREQPWYEKAQIWGFRGLLLLLLISYTYKTIKAHIQRISKK